MTKITQVKIARSTKGRKYVDMFGNFYRPIFSSSELMNNVNNLFVVRHSGVFRGQEFCYELYPIKFEQVIEVYGSFCQRIYIRSLGSRRTLLIKIDKLE